MGQGERYTRGPVESVRVSQLNIDRSYQQPVEMTLFNRHFDIWRPHLAETIHVSERADHSLWVIEGQRRKMAAEKFGIETLHAYIHRGLSIQDEANLYLELSIGRRQPRAFAQFMAELTRGDEGALQVEKAVTSAGLQFTEGSAPGKFTAVKAAQSVLRWYGEEVLQQTLEVLVAAYGADSPHAAQGGMLKAVGILLGQTGLPPIRTERLVLVIASKAPGVWIAQGKALQLRGARGVIYAILDPYNARLRKAKIDPTSIVFPRGSR